MDELLSVTGICVGHGIRSLTVTVSSTSSVLRSLQLGMFSNIMRIAYSAGRLQRKVARGDEDAGHGYDALSFLSSETCWADGNPNVPEEVQTNSSGFEGSLDALYEKRY